MKRTISISVLLSLVVALLAISPDSRASGADQCKVGNVMGALQAFYPGLIAVNEGVVEDGQFQWVIVRPGGVGDGLANCNFRLFAAAVSFIPDSYEFCTKDVFLGGNAWSLPYTNPAAQEYLDLYYPDISGYRNKAIAELSLIQEAVTVIRATYLDPGGNERPVGDGGPGDPAISDPTAGDPKPQSLIETDFRDFFNETGKVVYKHHGFFGQFEPGKYWVTTEQFFDGFPLGALPPVEVNIVTCD